MILNHRLVELLNAQGLCWLWSS